MDFRRFFLKLTLNIFPPLFFNRIYLKKISPDYKQMEVILKKSFSIHGAAQCGICTPGIMMSALALLRKNKFPNKEEVEFALSGVLCRCTGYQKIVDAVRILKKNDVKVKIFIT